jgi:hypothetical protein
MKTAIFMLALVVALGSSMIISSAKALPDNSGFGQASKALAGSSPGAMGDHASSFDSPRDGIGNVAKSNGLSVGQLGCFLGQAAGFNVC